MKLFYLSFCISLSFAEIFREVVDENLNQCLSQELPSVLVQEWQRRLTDATLTFTFDKVCSNRATCFGELQHELMIPQIMPYEVQHGTDLWFAAEMLPNNQQPLLRIYHVGADAFHSCDTTRGTPLTAEPAANTYVEPDFLTPGIHYFIAVSLSEEGNRYQCQNGMRVNLTVKANTCVPSTYAIDRLEQTDAVNCFGRGRCLSTRDQVYYKCACCPGYGGLYCEDSVSCTHLPCENGGTCMLLDTTVGFVSSSPYQCLCPPGYFGYHCEHLLQTMCDLFPCERGVCRGNMTGYQCECPRGWSGNHCEVNNNECANNPCGERGDCEDRNGEFFCHCRPGYMGRSCEMALPACGVECENGGVCVQVESGDHLCHCPEAYQGERCERRVNVCDEKHPCMNDGICEEYGNNYRCICHQGYSGSFGAKRWRNCEINVNECYHNEFDMPKCANGGWCVDDVNGFRCLCRLPWHGPTCELTASESDAAPRPILPDDNERSAFDSGKSAPIDFEDDDYNQRVLVEEEREINYNTLLIYLIPTLVFFVILLIVLVLLLVRCSRVRRAKEQAAAAAAFQRTAQRKTHEKRGGDNSGVNTVSSRADPTLAQDSYASFPNERI